MDHVAKLMRLALMHSADAKYCGTYIEIQEPVTCGVTGKQIILRHMCYTALDVLHALGY